MTDNPGYTADFIKSDTDQATFMKDPAMDHLMTALVSVSTELWVQARRMKIMAVSYTHLTLPTILLV